MQALLSPGPMHLNKVHFHRAGCVGEVCVHTGVGAEFRWWRDCVHPNLPWVLPPCFFPCCSSNPSTTVISWEDILLLLFLSWQWDPELCAFLPRILSLSYPSLPQNNLELLFCHGYCWGDSKAHNPPAPTSWAPELQECTIMPNTQKLSFRFLYVKCGFFFLILKSY